MSNLYELEQTPFALGHPALTAFQGHALITSPRPGNPRPARNCTGCWRSVASNHPGSRS